MTSRTVGPHPRTRTTPAYQVLIGVCTGVLLTGLLVPFAYGTRPDQGSGVQSGATLDGSDTATSDGAVAGTADQAAVPGSDGDADRRGADAAAGARGPGGDAAAAPASTLAGEGLTASDRGVIAEKIKVGVLVIDIGSIGRIGIAVPGLSPQEQKEAWSAFFRDLNERGGIHGRQVEHVFREFDLLDADDMRAACLELVLDQKVFAVVEAGGFHGPAVLCVTKENRTPLLGGGTVGTPKGYFRQSQGMLFTVQQAAPRLMRNFAWELGRLDLLKGRKIGILDGGSFPMGETMDVFAAALRDLGGDVVYRANLSQDYSTGASQVPVAVQQMRTKGVESVMLVSSLIYATQFVQAADGQGWYPNYYTTDWQAGSNDNYAAAMPASFDGALSISSTRLYEVRVGKPEPAIDAHCRQIWEEQTGKKVERGTIAYASTVEICNMVRLFEAGALGAGSNLTRTGLSMAIQGLRRFVLADFGDGAFRPGKFDAIDHMGTLRWYGDCKCFKPVEALRPVHDTSDSD